MGSRTQPEPEAYVRLLGDEARRLQHEARGALEDGDYARATALIGDAELLAGDVHDLVDDIEHRQIDTIAALAAADVVEADRARRRLHVPLPRRRLRIAIGASLAMSLALTEC